MYGIDQYIWCMLLLCLKYLSEEILPLLEMESKKKLPEYFNYQFSSVTQLCLTLCDPMDYSTPGFPVHHQLPELAQIHVHRVGDAIQPTHSVLSPSPPAFNLSQHQGLFQWVSSSHQVAKVLELQLQHQSFQWIFRTDGLSRVFSNTTVQKHPFFTAQLSLWSNSHIHTWLLEKPYLWLDGPLLAK